MGCGTGRLLGYLLEFGGDVVALDISAQMVELAGRRHPAADVRLGDLRQLSQAVSGRFDVVIASDNVIDVLDDGGRRRLLADLASHHLAPDGLLVFCSHNLDASRTPAPEARGGRTAQAAQRVARAAEGSPAGALRLVRALPRRRRNRRRLKSGEFRGQGFAVLNDVAHDYGLLHYYIGRDAQEQQLADAGMELLVCLDRHGRAVPPGSPGEGESLYYVAAVHAEPTR